MFSVLIHTQATKNAALANALKCKNIESMLCSPYSLVPHPSAQAYIFTGEYTLKEIIQMEAALHSIPYEVPLVFVGEVPGNFLPANLLLRSIHLPKDTQHGKVAELLLEMGLRFEPKLVIHKQLGGANVSLVPESRTLKYGSVEIRFSKKEFYMLQVLVRNSGRVTSRDTIMEFVWDGGRYISQNTIDVYMCRLRRKLKDELKRDFIETIPCLGYRFRVS